MRKDLSERPTSPQGSADGPNAWIDRGYRRGDLPRNTCAVNLPTPTLTVGCVQAIDLRVVPDEPSHANIQGVPYKEDDPEGAEWFATRLAECATIVDQGKVRRE